LKIIMLAAVALFIVGAIAEARDTHTVWGQGGTLWMLLGFAAVALEFTAPAYAARLHHRRRTGVVDRLDRSCRDVVAGGGYGGRMCPHLENAPYVLAPEPRTC
jgi:hypothetical protein